MKKEDAGQILWVGIPGNSLEEKVGSRLRKMRPGGIILFKRNISSAGQLQYFCHELHNLYDPPPLIGIDQEGGRVNRLSAFLPEIPDAWILGQHGDDMIVERLGILTGKALRMLGFDVDFAPVLDLSEPGSLNGIGDRAFSLDPEAVITMGAAFLRGLLSEGIAGTLKHFPGLGCSEIDSHDSLPTINKKKLSLSMEDIMVFTVLSEISPLIMIGHGYYPALSTGRIPATLSSEIISEILRKEIDFDGVIITDDMEMGAVKNYTAEGDEAVRALEAGCDMVMYASSMEMAEQAFEKAGVALEKGIIEKKQIAASFARIHELKENFIDREKAGDPEAKLKEISEEMRDISAKVKDSQ
jgi:beta-N-acetylhexosaminidase